MYSFDKFGEKKWNFQRNQGTGFCVKLLQFPRFNRISFQQRAFQRTCQHCSNLRSMNLPTYSFGDFYIHLQMRRNISLLSFFYIQLFYFRLIAATFKIFASEVLGYQFELVTEEKNDSTLETTNVPLTDFDMVTSSNNNEYPNNILAKLSSCESMM